MPLNEIEKQALTLNIKRQKSLNLQKKSKAEHLI
jgi:hypothetical protein